MLSTEALNSRGSNMLFHLLYSCVQQVSSCGLLVEPVLLMCVLRKWGH